MDLKRCIDCKHRFAPKPKKPDELRCRACRVAYNNQRHMIAKSYGARSRARKR